MYIQWYLQRCEIIFQNFNQTFVYREYNNMVLTHFIFLFVFFLIHSHSNGQDVCTTPGGTEGSCIPALSCEPLRTAFKNVKRPLSDTARKQFEAYICKETHKVCCPKEPIIITELSVRTSDNDESPTETITDITKHKNYGLLPTDCGFVKDSSYVFDIRVVNGEDAGLYEYPWMSLLSFRVPGNIRKFRCGGSIINNRYILTAAHCLEDKSNLLGVRVGEYNLSNNGADKDCDIVECNDPVQDLVIEEIISHPNYESKGKKNDIENIRPVCLPRTSNAKFNQPSAEVSGWGITKFGGRISKVLQKAYLKVVNPVECQNFYQGNLSTAIDDTRLCAGGIFQSSKSNACTGDSGGPLLVQEVSPDREKKYVQHGIVSAGVTRCDLPSLFTKVDYHLEWILDNMRA
ncbi:phenoloxidase-activating factor 3-like isoform X2 [Diabrotica virgifera virgifera]|uniref:CLIP domain-containing serine protease n=1 Tax=Diabrotica virgifera virgifera TaxID=50390 RepID=A0ABM5KJK1_DIAVI|nr:phenoloxidase-activating factor 3-like isoform X2 [Diabrotica virgifera virgifera]